MVIPIYISEASPPAIRGKLIGVFEIFLQVAQIFGFWVNYGVNIHQSPTDDVQWHIPFALQFIPGGLLSICMWFQPESPRWLLNANRIDQARKVLQNLRQLPADDEYLNWEINSVLHQIEQERALGAHMSFIAKVKEIATVPANRKRLLLGIALMFIQNMSGINALNYYSPSIFQAIGFTGTDVGLLATGIFGIVKAGATTVFMIWGIERIGRRNALLIGSAGAMTALLYIGAFAKVTGSFEGDGDIGGRSPAAYVAIVMIYIFAVFYAMSWNGIPWIFW
jgi:sugar porter (SP) family MFS transporter